MKAFSGHEFDRWVFEPQLQQARTSRDLKTVGRDGGFGALNVWDDAIAEGLFPPIVLDSN